MHHLPLLDAVERDRVMQDVLALEAHWTARHAELPSFTLGAASYLDSARTGDRSAYYAKAAVLNPLLEHHFGWLYDRVRELLSAHLGRPVEFERSAARPGFHIFRSHEAFRQPVAQVHLDLQFQLVDWPPELGVELRRPVSFTLPVRLPRSGGGLDTWPVSVAQFARSGASPEDFARARPPAYVPYEAGTLVCHSGLLLHRIAPVRGALEPDDLRVTLQGHLVAGRTAYWCYW